MEEMKTYHWPNEKQSEEGQGIAFWKIYHKNIFFKTEKDNHK